MSNYKNTRKKLKALLDKEKCAVCKEVVSECMTTLHIPSEFLILDNVF